MPLDRRGVVQLGLLIMVLPAQYFITSYFGANNSQKDLNLKRLFEDLSHYKSHYLSWDLWQAWCVDLFSQVKTAIMVYKNHADDEGESVAVEVINYRNSRGYFASSTEPRSPRPLHVKYRVGQVVKHKRENYRGVIIGWDAVLRAPDSWIKSAVPADKSDREDSAVQMFRTMHLRHSPAYLVLIDSRDRTDPYTAYVLEDDLEVLQRTLVIHPKLDNYFDGFNGYQHLPRQRLKVVYPHD